MRIHRLACLAAATLAAVACSACDKPAGKAPDQAAAKPPAAAPEAPPPADQEVSVNLLYAGEVSGGSKVGFDFRVLWGNWKHNKKLVEMASHSPQPSKLDLGCVDAKVVPVFPGGAQCQYVVKINDKQGKLMGDFRIQATGKQVKLADTATPGFTQRFVFYDEERRITAYRIQEQHGKQLGSEVGVLFIGEGWKVVDDSKKHSVDGKFEFPKVDMVVLPPEWMEYNEINQTFRTLKRGTSSPAGVCYS